MSKFVALFLVGAHASTVAIHEHFASEQDPNALLESMRALAKKAQEGKIDDGTLTFVANLTRAMRAKVDEGISCTATDENTAIVDRLGTLTELNKKLSQDQEAGTVRRVEIERVIDEVVTPNRALERDWDDIRGDKCGQLCDRVANNGPPTPPVCNGPGGRCDWLEDVEPCCDNETDQDAVPNSPRRSDGWRQLEKYMEDLDSFMAGPWVDYMNLAGECKNASESWKNQKSQIDPSDQSVAREMCNHVSSDEHKCTHYFTNWDLNWRNYLNSSQLAKVIIENGFRQHDAMRKVECYWSAILSGENITAQTELCEQQVPECNEMCDAGRNCPAEFTCPACCLPPPPPQPCNNLDKCDICTARYRHEFHECPFAEWNADDGELCEHRDGKTFDKATGGEISGVCRLLIAQIGCTGFECAEQCKDKGTIPASGPGPFRNTIFREDAPDGQPPRVVTGSYPERNAFEPFCCGGECIGNRDFV